MLVGGRPQVLWEGPAELRADAPSKARGAEGERGRPPPSSNTQCPITPGTRQTRPTKRPTFPHQKAKKSCYGTLRVGRWLVPGAADGCAQFRGGLIGSRGGTIGRTGGCLGPFMRRLTPQVVAQAGRPHCHLSGPAAQERVKATSKRAHAQDSGTVAYLLELSPIVASCHHRFCIEDFPSPNPSRFKPRPYRGISIKNRDKTNTTWPTKNSSHNESNPHLSAL